MAETVTNPPGNLESALLTAEDTLESKRKVLQLLFDSRVYVVLDQPWDGRSLPSTDMRLLFVSDGKNNEQAMLALFTSREKCAGIPGHAALGGGVAYARRALPSATSARRCEQSRTGGQAMSAPASRVAIPEDLQ